MEAVVTGIGAWGPGFCNLQEFKTLFLSETTTPADDVVPKPTRIPSRERRRAPLMVRLAVEVADQACVMAEVDPATAQSVFSSGIGDADITDYMCRVLAGPDKLLSPTKFHNSVHNAAAGVWSISTGCERPATFVSSMKNSFSMALIEALVQVTTDKVPVLLIMTDLKMPVPMMNMHPIERLLGVSLLLSPAAVQSPSSAQVLNRRLSLELKPVADNQPVRWPDIQTTAVRSLYEASPSARSLCLLEALSRDESWQVTLPVSDQLGCRVLLAEDPT